MTNVEQTGGEALVAALTANGVDAMFAIPGIQLDWAVDALSAAPEISVYVPRHEQSVSYMADGYARVTGEPGVGMVVPGPGMLNATAGLSTAYACNSPVVFLVGQIHSKAIGKGYGSLHEIPDQSGVLRGLTKLQQLVRDRADISTAVDRAFAVSMAGRRRPAAVEIPYDLLMGKGAAASRSDAAVAAPAAPDQKLIEKAAELIDAAKFPVIYIGGGAIDAGAEIAALAEKLGAPVVASDNGRGAIADSHPLMFNALAGRPLFSKADLVLVIGSRFMDIMVPEVSWPQEGKTFLYLNIDPADMGGPRKGSVNILADAAAGAEALAGAVKRREGIDAGQARGIKEWAQGQIAATGTLWNYVAALRNPLPDDGILVTEPDSGGLSFAHRIRMPAAAHPDRARLPRHLGLRFSDRAWSRCRRQRSPGVLHLGRRRLRVVDPGTGHRRALQAAGDADRVQRRLLRQCALDPVRYVRPQLHHRAGQSRVQ